MPCEVRSNSREVKILVIAPAKFSAILLTGLRILFAVSRARGAFDEAFCPTARRYIARAAERYPGFKLPRIIPPYICVVKRVTAIMIFLCLTVQCMAQVAVLGLFELNKEYIAKNLCENRDQPKMSCCGKCYLGKQLTKTEEDTRPSGNAPIKTVKSEVPPCLIPAPSEPEFASGEVHAAAPQNPVQRSLHARLFTTSIFHPPAAGR